MPLLFLGICRYLPIICFQELIREALQKYRKMVPKSVNRLAISEHWNYIDVILCLLCKDTDHCLMNIIRKRNESFICRKIFMANCRIYFRINTTSISAWKTMRSAYYLPSMRMNSQHLSAYFSTAITDVCVFISSNCGQCFTFTGLITIRRMLWQQHASDLFPVQGHHVMSRWQAVLSRHLYACFINCDSNIKYLRLERLFHCLDTCMIHALLTKLHTGFLWQNGFFVLITY